MSLLGTKLSSNAQRVEIAGFQLVVRTRIHSIVTQGCRDKSARMRETIISSCLKSATWMSSSERPARYEHLNNSPFPPVRVLVKVMKAKNVLFFVLFQGMVGMIVYAAEEDSKLPRSVFFTARQNKQLKGHVFKRFESPSLTSCSHSCLRNSWCTSTNFKMPSEN